MIKKKRIKNVEAVRASGRMFGTACVVCGKPYTIDTHHCDGDPSNPEWQNLYPVCPNENQGLERSMAILLSNPQPDADLDDHLSVACLTKKAFEWHRAGRFELAHACFKLASQISFEREWYNHAIQNSMLSIWALRPILFEYELCLKDTVNVALDQAVKAAQGRIPSFTKADYCRHVGALFHGEDRQDWARFWLMIAQQNSQGLRSNYRTEEKILAGRIDQHLGFVSFRLGDPSGIRLVQISSEYLGEHMYHKANNIQHLAHFYLDRNDLNAAGSMIEQLAYQSPRLEGAINGGNFSAVVDVYGTWMALAIFQLHARFHHMLGKTNTAVDYAQIFLKNLGSKITNQGSLPFPGEIAMGSSLPFKRLSDPTIDMLHRKFFNLWNLMQ